MANSQDFLSSIPLFSFLGRDELAAVQKLFVESTHKRGEVICRAGDEGDKFYIVLSGELEVWAGQRDRRKREVRSGLERRSRNVGNQLQTGTLQHGDFFGEMALLQGGKRTATVVVKRQARLASLDKASFESLFFEDSRALRHFTRVLCDRLERVSKGQTVNAGTMVISVAGAPGLKGKSLVASSLAAILHDVTGSDVLLVRVNPGKNARGGAVVRLLSDDRIPSAEAIGPAIQSEGPGLAVLDVSVPMEGDPSFYTARISNLISEVIQHFRFIVFDLASEPRSLIESAQGFSDVIVEIIEKLGQLSAAEGRSQSRHFQVINLFNAGSEPISINHCEPFVIPNDSSLRNGNSPAQMRSRLGGAGGLPIRRLARKVLRSTIGIALGGGAAFGIAHLGVLKVLQQNDIPIDMVVGCSQGSIIGVGYAAGISVDEMIDISHQLGKKRNFLLPMDLTLSKPGILAGNRFVEIFSPFLKGKETFEDLRIPCRTVATDIRNGERVEIGSGKLTDAFRASSSVPMVFAPFSTDHRVLVDGGVADPVPVEVINNMGADLSIAVNVVPPLKLGLENEVSRAYRILNKLNPLSYLGDSRNLPNLFDIIMNAMQTLQYELGNFKAISAGVLINPDLSDFTWIEYYRSAELIQRGMDAAERALPAIKRAYAEKLAPFQISAST